MVNSVGDYTCLRSKSSELTLHIRPLPRHPNLSQKFKPFLVASAFLMKESRAATDGENDILRCLLIILLSRIYNYDIFSL